MSVGDAFSYKAQLQAVVKSSCSGKMEPNGGIQTGTLTILPFGCLGLASEPLQ